MQSAEPGIHLYRNARRSIIDANFMTYATPYLHPNRIMDIHDIVFMLDGEWEICQDGAKYVLVPGDVLFLSARHHHYGITPCKAGTRTMFVHFDMHAEDLSDSLPTQNDHIQLQMHSNYKANRQVQVLIERIISTYWSTVNEKNYRLSALVDLLLAELSSNSIKAILKTSSLIRDIQRIVCMEPQVNVTPEMFAERLNISVRSIRYYFKKETGISLHQYQLQTKLDMAFQQLQMDNRQTIHGLAFNYGFYDEFHFSRLFKKKFGISPSQVVAKYATQAQVLENP